MVNQTSDARSPRPGRDRRFQLSDKASLYLSDEVKALRPGGVHEVPVAGNVRLKEHHDGRRC